MKKGEKAIEIEELINRRRRLWEKNHSASEDEACVFENACEIYKSPDLHRRLAEQPHLLIECCFSVVDKSKETVPFFFNEVQRDFVNMLEKHGSERPYFILKGRQQGFTTLITAIQLCHALLKRNFSGFTMADREDNTRAIFQDKAKIMLNNLPSLIRPTATLNSSTELYFEGLNSSWRVACAGNNKGRSRTLSFIHFSELAFFHCPLSDLQRSISEAATKNAIRIYETTADGFNEAKTLWDSGTCHNLFYEWWKTREYVCTDLSYLETNDPWLKERLKILESKGLTKEQQAWYAKKYASYIDKSSIRQEYPCTPEEAFIVTSECVFDKDAISNYLSRFDVLSTQGSFKYEKAFTKITGNQGEIQGYEKHLEHIKFEENERGYIKIVEKPYLERRGRYIYKKPYVIGADTAGSGKDYFAAKVIDNTNGRCVATLHVQQMDEDLFAEQLYCLGKYYNDALLAIEVNFSAYPIRVLKELGYKNLYSRAYGGLKKAGFITSSATRPIIISNLVAIMRECIELETDRETLKELCSFVRGQNGRCEAVQGAHDDLVMASAIARHVGIDYSHEIEIIVTGSSILDRMFKVEPTEEIEFLEW